MSRSTFVTQCTREMKLLARAPVETLNPVLFLLLAVTLFGLSAQAESSISSAQSAGVIWVVVLLANMLSLEGLFRRDFDDGSLEQLVLLAPVPEAGVLAKGLVQWLATGLPATLLAPLFAAMLGIPDASVGRLMLALAVGTPALTLIGAVGAALTVGLRRGGVLLGLLVLPLYVPILIFGTGAVTEHIAGMHGMAQIYWLGAISMAALSLTPFAIAAALRISLEN